MAYLGKKGDSVVVLGDVPAAALADHDFRAQFDSIFPDADEARALCAAHIDEHYPMHRQLNVMRTGSDDEKAQMGTFIDACRAWSNGDTPDLAALASITP